MKELLQAACDITIHKSAENIGKKRANIIALRKHHALIRISRGIVDLRKLTIILITGAGTQCNVLYARTGKSATKVGKP